MKQIFISFFLTVVLTVALPVISLAEKSVTILYSGNMMGYITPLRG